MNTLIKSILSRLDEQMLTSRGFFWKLSNLYQSNRTKSFLSVSGGRNASSGFLISHVILSFLIASGCNDSPGEVRSKSTNITDLDGAVPPAEVAGGYADFQCGLENLGIGCVVRREGFALDVSKVKPNPTFELYTSTLPLAQQPKVKDIAPSESGKMIFNTAPSSNSWGMIIVPANTDILKLVGFVKGNLSNPGMAIGVAIQGSLAGERIVAPMTQCTMIDFLTEWGNTHPSDYDSKQVTAIPTSLGNALLADSLVKEAVNQARTNCQSSKKTSVEKKNFETQMGRLFSQWVTSENVDVSGALTKAIAPK